MGKLINMVMRVGMWGAFGALLGLVGVLVVQVFFQGGALQSALNSAEAIYGGMVGAAAGAVVGFFRRN